MNLIIHLISGHILFAQSGWLRINEFMALNQTGLTDEDGEYSDWIEIFNASSGDVDLLGWSLTDEKNNSRKWIFPDVIIEKNDYLIIFASDKNRKTPDNELHTNFKLSGDGEYLALISPAGEVVSGFDPFFPVQQTDISFGYYENHYLSFLVPTPGAENSLTGGTLVPSPVFNKNHGFYLTPFNLEINCSDPGAEIYYTTDGSVPNAGNGTKYTIPLNIESTAIIRAVAVKVDQDYSRITTRTYLFPDDIIHQTNTPEGYPATWAQFISISGIAPGDYEMDPEMMADPQFADSAKVALLDLPVISLVTDKGYFFSKSADRDTGGIYIYTGTAQGMGYGWERPVSFEYFDARDSVSLQVDCGIQIHGGEGRRPEKSPKHSFRLIFRGEYGPSKFNFPLFGDDAASTFNDIILRAGFGNTWIHWSHSERSMAQYLRDRWTKDTQLAMGHHSSHGIYVHLYINGLYWGIYNPSEKMDNDFAESYFGGNKLDYDVIKDYSEAVDGYLTAWNTTMSLANAGLAGNEAYQRLRGNNPDGTRNPAFEPMVDVVNLADYMLVNFYGGNWDWDHHNWVAIRNRISPDKGFKFFCWDAEHMVERVNANILSENNDKCPSCIFQQLRQNADFRRLFADRVQKFCFNDGVLTPGQSIQRWTIRAGQIEKAVLAESARWGDYRRDVHQWQTAGPFDLYTKESYWLPQRHFMLNTYFPNRTDVFLNQLRNAGLFPNVDAPVFFINNYPAYHTIVKKGDLLKMTSEKGNIWFTIDGSDPAVFVPVETVSLSAIMYTGPLPITESCYIKARTFHNGEWSATNEQYFIIPENYYDLKITEIHYHPLDEEDVEDREFEFIEIKNTGSSTLNLRGIHFVEGIEYKFKEDFPLKPQRFVVLASNSDCFYDRYGFLPYDEFEGQLDNSGESLVLINPGRDTLCSFWYRDSGGWPVEADGGGRSLVPTEYNPANNQDLPEYWRASYYTGGSPDADDMIIPENVVTSEIMTLYQNYPNPFNSVTYLPYRLHSGAHINLSVYNIAGQHIITLENVDKPSGYYVMEWNGLDQNNGRVADGIYFFRIAARGKERTSILTCKMLLIR